MITQMQQQAQLFERLGLHFEVWMERATGELCVMYRKDKSRTVWVCFVEDSIYYAYHLPDNFESEYEQQ